MGYGCLSLQYNLNAISHFTCLWIQPIVENETVGSVDAPCRKATTAALAVNALAPPVMGCLAEKTTRNVVVGGGKE